MVLLKESKKQEAYTPLDKFEDRTIDLQTFFEGIKINFKRELTLYLVDRGKDELIVTADPAHVKIDTSAITITNRNLGIIHIIPFRTLNLKAISEVSNADSIAYIFPLVIGRYYYRIDVR